MNNTLFSNTLSSCQNILLIIISTILFILFLTGKTGSTAVVSEEITTI